MTVLLEATQTKTNTLATEAVYLVDLRFYVDISFLKASIVLWYLAVAASDGSATNKKNLKTSQKKASSTSKKRLCSKL